MSSTASSKAKARATAPKRKEAPPPSPDDEEDKNESPVERDDMVVTPATAAAAPETAGVTGLDDAPEKEAPSEAYTAFLADAAKSKVQTRTIRSGGGGKDGGATISAEGVVTRMLAGTRMVKKPGSTNGEKHSVPIIEVAVLLTLRRGNGAIDYVEASPDGEAFIMPTVKHTANADVQGRDVTDDDPNGGGPGTTRTSASALRELGVEPNCKAYPLDNLNRLVFFTMTAKGVARGNMDALAVGMPCEITGITATRSPDGQHVYLDAANITPKLDGMTPGHVCKAMIAELERPAVMKAHAAVLAKTMGCWVGVHDNALTPATAVQANFFRESLVESREGLAAALDAKAMAVRADLGDDCATARTLEGEATRIRSIPHAALALGEPFFRSPREVSADRPVHAAGFVVKGMTPALMRHEYLKCLFDGGAASKPFPPETFAAFEPREVEINKSLITCKYRGTFIGSKAEALSAIKNRNNPLLDSGKLSCLGVKFSMRSLAQDTGILVEEIAEGFCRDLLMHGEYCIMPTVTPRRHDDTGVACTFPNGYAFDMVASLRLFTAVVDEAWIKANLCGGTAQWIPPERAADVKMLQSKEVEGKSSGNLVIEKPTLTKQYYKEISSEAFNLVGMRKPPDAPNIEYRLWWPGVADAIADDPDVARKSAAGAEACKLAVERAPQMRLNEEHKMLSFLTTFCAVYMVATA